MKVSILSLVLINLSVRVCLCKNLFRSPPLLPAPDVNPCATILCRVGQVCELQDVQCIRAPCPPVAVCVDRPIPTTPEEEDPCALVDCPVGQVCRPQQVQCIQAPCPPLPVCVDAPPPEPLPPVEEANPCAVVDCVEGKVCTLNQVQCVTTPCPPLPVCVDNPCLQCPDFASCKVDGLDCSVNPCRPIAVCTADVCNRNCPAGQVCSLTQVFCFAPPCFPTQSCETDPCTFTTCETGTICKPILDCTNPFPCRPIATCVASPPPTTCPLNQVCRAASSDFKSCVKANRCCRWLGGRRSFSLGGRCIARRGRRCSPRTKPVPCNADSPLPPPPKQQLVCPTPTGFGICVELCFPGGCPEGQLCCSNGCGNVCMDGVPA